VIQVIDKIKYILEKHNLGITGEGVDSCGRSTVFFQYPGGFGSVSVDEFCLSVYSEFGHQGTISLEQLDQLPEILWGLK
jgi:hypothetical protein